MSDQQPAASESTGHRRLENTDTIAVRPARRDDIEAIARFNVAMARETESRQLSLQRVRAGVKKLFDRPEHGFYVVAELRNEVAASLMITYEWSDWRCGVFWWIQSVYVRPEFRKRGVFSAMYEFLKTAASRQRDVCGFRLYVEKNNAIAASTYEKLGLAEVSYRFYEEEFDSPPADTGDTSQSDRQDYRS